MICCRCVCVRWGSTDLLSPSFCVLCFLHNLLNVEPAQQYLAGVPFRPLINAHHRITMFGVMLMNSLVLGKMVMHPKSPIKGLSRANGVIGTGSPKWYPF
jgi:hypothetical protein